MTKKHVLGGMMLIGVGALMLVANLEMISGLWVLAALSGGFLAAYRLIDRHLGFLIPGLILGGLAGFAALNESVLSISGGYLFFFFAAAFYLVYALHTRHLNTPDKGEKIWPLFPGTALLAVGLLVLGLEGNHLSETFLRSLNMILPVGLILAGLVVFTKKARSGSSR